MSDKLQVKRKLGPKPKEEIYNIKLQLKKLIESGLIHGISNTKLEGELNINRMTIGKYIDELYRDMPPDDIKKIYIDFSVLFDRLFRESYKMLQQSKSLEDKRKTITVISQLIKDKTMLLENFFVKQKAIDKVVALNSIAVTFDDGKDKINVEQCDTVVEVKNEKNEKD